MRGADDIADGWRRQIQAHKGPLYLSIVEALADSIRSGDLQEGDRLPPQRRLASALDVDLTTVTRAFNEARRRGLLDATVGRGSFVRPGAAAARWRDDRGAVVDMTMIVPPPLADPSLRHLLQDGLARLLKRQDTGVLMSYRMAAGTAEERAAGAAWLRPLLGPREPDEVLVVPGAQSAMLAVATTVLQTGDAVLAERFTYPGLRALAAQLGLALSGVAMDVDGLVPDALDRALRETRARLVYCTPNIQNPTTATMPLDRRRAILAVVQRHGAMILEDDPYGLLPDVPLPALAQLAPGRVFHVATLSKALSPGLRTAFLVAPGPEQAQRLTAAVRATSMTGSGLLTGLAAQWIRGGQAAAVLGAVRRELAARQAAARDVLGEAPCAHPQGPHIWLRLPQHWGGVDFVSYVRRQGLALVPGEVFTVEGDAPPRVRIALGTVPDEAALRESLHAVAAALRHRRIPGYGGVV